MKLLVTRPALDAGPLSDLLTAAGHTVLLDPLLSIRFRDRGALDLDGATGLLFTSGNGVRAFAALSQRRDIPAYAVGDRTATLARELGFGQIDSADGDVAALVALVRAQRKPEDGLLLHVSGHDVAGELAQSLEAAGYGVRRAVLYDAEPAADLAPATRTALDTGTLDGVLLFSPRTARHFVALMHQSGLASHASRIEAWCLSPAVAQALDGLNLARIHTAAEPTQAALLSLVPPAPKEDVLTEAPPPKTPPTGKGPAIKKARVEPTIAAAIPPDEPASEPRAEPTVTETPLTGGMADADAIGAAKPPAAKPRRSPIVWIGLVVVVLIGAAVLGPMIKTRLEDAGYLGGASSPPREAETANPPAGPTLHADGGAAPEASSGPQPTTPAHEPAADTPPAPETRAEAPAPDASAPPDAPAPATASANPPSSEPVPGALTARLVAAEGRLDRLQASAAPIAAVNGLQQGVTVLGQRLASLEAKPSADPASVQAVAADLQRVTANLTDAANRIARLELQVQQQATAQRNEKATVLALAELKDRLAGSGPFDGPVGVLKSADGDDPAAAPALATLDRFAAQGVASRAKLAEELAGLPAAINQSLPPAADAGIWQRIQARAEKLVTVRRIDDSGNVDNLPPGPDHNLAVAAAALRAGDLAGAVQAVQAMDGHAGEVVKPWLAEARDRLAVEDAVGRLTTLATQRLQGTGMPAPAATPAAAPEPASDQGAPQ